MDSKGSARGVGPAMEACPTRTSVEPIFRFEVPFVDGKPVNRSWDKPGEQPEGQHWCEDEWHGDPSTRWSIYGCWS